MPTPRSGPADLETAVNPRVTLEIPRQGSGGGIGHCITLCKRWVQAETLCIGREHQQPARLEEAHAGIDQRRMVALDVEHPLHAFGVRESRRVEENELIPLAGAAVLTQPIQTVRLHELVLHARGCALGGTADVAREIAL